MLKGNKFWLAAILATGMALPSYAEKPTAETVLATVNGVKITVGHLIAAKGTLPEQYQALGDEVLFEGILEQLIQQTVLSQSFEGAEPKRVGLLLENDRRAQRASIVLDAKIIAAMNEDAVQAAYVSRYADLESETEFNASHILVETEDEAKIIRKMLDDGGNFVQLAKENSTGPSGDSGGSLGWFSKGVMVKPFEDAVIDMEAGEISDPIQTQFGWHILILNETRLKDTPSLESVRAEIEAVVQEAALEGIVKDLTDKASITRADTADIPASVLGSTALID